MNEFEFIEKIKSWIQKETSKSDNADIVGIGDDCACLPYKKNNRNSKILTCIDTMVEDVHFNRQITSFYDLGWKALAINLSDISAMGGRANYALISFAMTLDLKEQDLKDFYFGFRDLAELAGVRLVGGDTVRSNTKIVVSVSLIGETINKPILRAGAKLDDFVCLTGKCGNSAKGLKELLNIGKTNESFYRAFNRPMPRFIEAEIIAKNKLANSMIDVSDGLVFSLYELVKNTKLGILLDYDFDEDALYGGEDYELLFTCPKSKIKKAKELLKNLVIIGSINNSSNKVVYKNKVLENRGYRAF